MKCIGLEHTVERLGEPIQKPVKRVTFSSFIYFKHGYNKDYLYNLAHEDNFDLQYIFFVKRTLKMDKVLTYLNFSSGMKTCILGKWLNI